MEQRYWNEYKDTQYDEYTDDGLFLYNFQINARYIQQTEPTFTGNLLIEALPPVLNFRQLIHRVKSFPLYADSERECSKEYRITAISRLEKFVLPLAFYDEVYTKISMAIRRGYEGKKIMSPEFIKGLNESSKLMKATEIEQKNYLDAKCMIRKDFGAQYGFSIFGISGVGKSTVVNRMLCTIPSCIIHTGTGGEKYLFKQVPWVKIDCAHNGTVKGLCENFFSYMDGILGTNYLDHHGGRKNSINSMIISMKHIAQKHALGVLVVDEIQHLANSKGQSGNALDFFVTLMNEIRIPIIYIGTYKAIPHVLGKEFTQARRSTGIGTVYCKNIEFGVEGDWDFFIENLWGYQWTKEKVELTNEFKHVMYEETMGIPDRVVKLFMATQIQAILDEKEKITPGLIRKVSKEKMALTKGMIEALKQNDPNLLSKYGDMVAPKLEDMYDLKKYTSEDRERIRIMREELKEKKYTQKRELISNLVFFFSQFGYEYDVLNRTVEKIVDKYGVKEDIEFLKRKVGEEIFNNSYKGS